jgi:hypothetical protein
MILSLIVRARFTLIRSCSLTNGTGKSSTSCASTAGWMSRRSPNNSAFPQPPCGVKTLRILSYIGKVSGFVTALGSIPFVDPKLGIIIFAAASILKDTTNRIGDIVDDGKSNQSFNG